MKKRRYGVYLEKRLADELEGYVKTFGVSAPYVLTLAYKLADRKALEGLLRLKQSSE